MPKKKILLLLSLIIVLSSCGKTKEPEVTEIIQQDIVPVLEVVQEDKPAVTENVIEKKSSIIVYIEGNVEHFTNGEWNTAQIGAEVNSQDQIKTGAEGYCELQFAEKSILKILDNSLLNIEELLIEENSLVLEANLENGSILAKLKKLTNLEKFRIKTDQVVAGVRGTEFFVSSIEGTTVVSVDEGAVEVYPNLIEVIAFKDSVEGMQKGAAQESMLKTIPVVALGETFTITKEELEEIVPDIVESYSELNDVIQDETLAPEAMEEAAKETIEVLQIKKEQIEELKAETTVEEKEVFKELEDSYFLESEEEEITLYVVNINVQPVLAKIYLDDKFSATGNIQKVYEERELLLRIEADGYIDQELNIKTSDLESQNVKIILEAEEVIEEEVIEEEVLEEIAEEIILAEVNLEIVQNNTELKINGEIYTNKIIELEINKNHTIEVSSPGYDTYTTDFYLEEAGFSEKIDLKEVLIIKTASISSSSFIRKATKYKSNWIIANKDGEVFSIKSNGEKNWSVDTGNKQNQNSYPIVTIKWVFFSGSSTAYLINSDTGDVILSQDLGAESSHIFGRTAYPAAGGILYPENNKLVLKSFKDLSTLVEANLPNPSSSSPLEFKDKWYITDSTGNLLKIDPSTGDVITQFSAGIGQMVASAPVTLSGNSILVSDRKGNLSAINVETDAVLWSQDYTSYGGQIYTDPIVYNNYSFVLTNGGIIAFNNDDGSLRYILENATSVPLIYKYSVLWMVNDTLMVSDLKSGTLNKEIKVISSVMQPTRISNNLLIAGDDGQIMILNLDRVLEQ